MTWDIAVLLAQDGIINAAIYGLLALSLILVFTVTRILFVPQGEFVSFGALTLASLQQGHFPGTVYLLLAFGVVAAIYEVVGAARLRRRPDPTNLVLFLVYPPALFIAMRGLDLHALGIAAQIAITLAIVVPLGPMLYRIVFQPLAGAKILILLIAAVAAHLAFVGLGLLVFGPEGSRTSPLSDAVMEVGPMTVTGQSVIVLLFSVLLMLALAWTFASTLLGKALRATAVNRVGARVVGIRPERAGRLCLLLAAVAGTSSGILISSLTTIYYDSGFVIALKGLVAAIVGGLVSYPIAVGGAVFIGMVESFASFQASAYREVIVFLLVIPLLLARSLADKHAPEEE